MAGDEWQGCYSDWEEYMLPQSRITRVREKKTESTMVKFTEHNRHCNAASCRSQDIEEESEDMLIALMLQLFYQMLLKLSIKNLHYWF